MTTELQSAAQEIERNQSIDNLAGLYLAISSAISLTNGQAVERAYRAAHDAQRAED